MTRYYLKRVRIEGFRGINNETEPLDIKFKSECVNSIFAPNGLGKSSVFDSLCYAIRCAVPKLDGLHAAEKANEYYCNRFHSMQKATIALTLESDDGTSDTEILVERSAQGGRRVTSPTGHPDPESLLRSIDNAFILVDHRMFLRFVEDSPLDRGRTFSSLLGLAQLSEFRQVLEVLSHGRTIKSDFQLDTLESQLKTHNVQAQLQLRTIRSLYKELLDHDVAEPIAHHHIVAEATQALARVPLLQPFFDGADIVSVDYNKIRAALERAEGNAQRQRLSTLLQFITAIDAAAPTKDEAAEQAELRQCIKERDEALAKTSGPLLKDLYRAVLDFTESGEWDDLKRCPACESVLDAPIDEAMRVQLQQYRVVDDCQNRVANLWQSASWVSRIKRMEEDPVLSVAAENRTFAKFDASFRDGSATLDLLDEATSRIADLDIKRTAQLKEYQAERLRIEKTLPPSLVSLTRKVEHAQQLKTALESYATSVETSELVFSTIERRKRWQRFIDKTCRVFCEAELKLSTLLTTAIETQYRDIYVRITNNPEVVPVLLRARGSEDLHLRLERFYSLRDLSATTLLPESYRNALAISIFLSAALQASSSGRFIVLDDVTSSFDAGHQFALMELLRTVVARPGNPNGPQIVILSHDGLLEKYFDKLSNDSTWHHQRLQGLPPCGCVLSQTQSASRLRDLAGQFLNAGEVQRAEPLMRQYLEFKLLEIIRSANIPVPLDFAIRDDRKMVDNALKACTAAIQVHQKAGTLVLDPSQVRDLTQLHAPAIIANWVTHYATGVTCSLSPYALFGVLDSIDKFSECFQYTCNCSGKPTVRYYRSLESKGCRC